MAGYWGSAGEVSMRHAAAIALMMSLPFAAAMADVYRSVDAQGHVQYSDTPTPGAELVHLQALATRGPARSTAPPAGSAAQSNAQVQEPLQQQAAQRAVQQDVAQSREDQCKKATTDYDQIGRASCRER